MKANDGKKDYAEYRLTIYNGMQTPSTYYTHSKSDALKDYNSFVADSKSGELPNTGIFLGGSNDDENWESIKGNVEGKANGEMDWNNVDLTDSYEKDQDFLNSYSFDTLLMEIHCNIPKEKITPEVIMKHAKEVLKNRYDEALSILESNLTNITNEAKK